MTDRSFSQEQLVSFGTYLLSAERKENFKNHPEFPNDEALEERLSQVHDADFDNWKAAKE